MAIYWYSVKKYFKQKLGKFDGWATELIFNWFMTFTKYLVLNISSDWFLQKDINPDENNRKFNKWISIVVPSFVYLDLNLIHSTAIIWFVSNSFFDFSASKSNCTWHKVWGNYPTQYWQKWETNFDNSQTEEFIYNIYNLIQVKISNLDNKQSNILLTYNHIIKLSNRL